MCNAFINTFMNTKTKLSFLIGFNSCSTIIMDTNTEKLNFNKIYGYDL